MKLRLEIEYGIDLLHKSSGKEVNIDKTISIEYDEYSSEYKTLCKEYEDKIGFSRESNPDEFDKKMLLALSDDIKPKKSEMVDPLVEVVRSVYSQAGTHGYIEYGGYVINVEDFSYIHFRELDIRISKK
jgi:hypothetical protein